MSRLAPSSLRMSSGALPEYLLELGNGAKVTFAIWTTAPYDQLVCFLFRKAICRTYGGNCFSYITKDGIEVMGTRADAPNPIADTKPYAGGSPHCFPQFGPGALMQHGFARGMKFIPGGCRSQNSFQAFTSRKNLFQRELKRRLLIALISSWCQLKIRWLCGTINSYTGRPTYQQQWM